MELINRVEINLLTYKFTSTVAGQGGTVLNEYNGHISFLGDNDTLAIQENKIIYKLQ